MAEKKVEIKVRLTPKEAARLQRLVKRTGLSREAYLRHLIGGVVPQEIPPPDYYAFMERLYRVGNLLEQISRQAQAMGMEFPPSMGLLIENPAFLGQYTGAENLEMLASLHQNVAKEDVRTLLEKVGLAADGDTKYRKYSLGMKQRLGIAGAILGKPELLLLDEPTNALDTKGVELLREIIGEERQRGAAVVVACHDAAFLESVSDEIYCLENGQLTDHLILREKGGSKP